MDAASGLPRGTNLRAVVSVTNIDGAADNNILSVYVCNTARAGGQNRHFPARSAASSKHASSEVLERLIATPLWPTTALQRDASPPRARYAASTWLIQSAEETSIWEATATESLVEVRFTVPPRRAGSSSDCRLPPIASIGAFHQWGPAAVAFDDSAALPRE